MVTFDTSSMLPGPGAGKVVYQLALWNDDPEVSPSGQIVLQSEKLVM